MKHITIFTEYNCQDAGNEATAWLLNKRFDEDKDFPDELERISDIEGILKLRGPSPVDEIEEFTKSLADLLASVGLTVIHERTADD